MKTFIIGLGNPGTQFAQTPHNAGFEALDFFAKKNDFPEFKLSKKYELLISMKDGITLGKPQTFMNESGRAVRKLILHHAGQLLVIHDDIDLPLGKIKLSKNNSSGGHKGVDSIIAALGTKDFIRLKIGIGAQRNEQKIKAEEIVLRKFSLEEKEIMQTSIQTATQVLDLFMKEGLEKAMNECNH